jgi:hypothetical protein
VTLAEHGNNAFKYEIDWLRLNGPNGCGGALPRSCNPRNLGSTGLSSGFAQAQYSSQNPRKIPEMIALTKTRMSPSPSSLRLRSGELRRTNGARVCGRILAA